MGARQDVLLVGLRAAGRQPLQKILFRELGDVDGARLLNQTHSWTISTDKWVERGKILNRPRDW